MRRLVQQQDAIVTGSIFWLGLNSSEHEAVHVRGPSGYIDKLGSSSETSSSVDVEAWVITGLETRERNVEARPTRSLGVRLPFRWHNNDPRTRRGIDREAAGGLNRALCCGHVIASYRLFWKAEPREVGNSVPDPSYRADPISVERLDVAVR